MRLLLLALLAAFLTLTLTGCPHNGGGGVVPRCPVGKVAEQDPQTGEWGCY